MSKTRVLSEDIGKARLAASRAGYRAGLLLPDGPQVDVMAAVRPGLYEPGSLLDDAYGWQVLSSIWTRRAGGGTLAMPLRQLKDVHGCWNVSLARAFVFTLDGPETWSTERLCSMHLASGFDLARVEHYSKPKWARLDFLEMPLLAAPRNADGVSGWALLDGHDQLELARRCRVPRLQVYVLDWTCAQVCFTAS
ncbi:hypothetical protein [Deinococcus ruber]|uniref:Uncharacterized protein n=1 Tax=Deinococcus ruber TaxID=1848197 RepID=A0A918CA06_9DEIO|nr:hypothetical protein [Deinococcus ruber]GGR12696.1 hypothetical protein GCM10008957_27020 [Deinococcus ruber]